MIQIGYMTTAAIRRTRSGYPYSPLANVDEHLEHVGHSKQVAHLLADIDELQGAACGTSGDVQTSQRTESHAVHAREVGEVEHHSLRTREELAGFSVEHVADACHQL